MELESLLLKIKKLKSIFLLLQPYLVKGKDNSASAGMPELAFLGEIGLRMIFMLGEYYFDKRQAKAKW